MYNIDISKRLLADINNMDLEKFRLSYTLKTKAQNYGRIFPPKFYVSNLVFVFSSLQFNFVKYVIVVCELPNDNSLDQRMLLKN